MKATLYRHVIDTLVGRIASGDLPPGAMLPSETQLGAELGVSQGTARKALIEMEARGLVQRAQGRGTFVTVRTPENSLFNFFRLRRPDGTMETPLLESEKVRRRPSRAAERAALFDAPGSVFEIERIRTVGETARLHETSVVSASLFPGLADRAPLPNTLYVFYQQAYSCIIVRAEERLRAVAADVAMAAALGVAEGTPLLAVSRHSIDVLDRVVELRSTRALAGDLGYVVALT